ncbi:MAG: hypothetical protein WC095_02485 [Candidatus Paceibacterota bacterium]
MIRNPYIRIFLFFVAWFLLLVLPWWLTLVVLVGLAVYVPFYLEIIFFGLVFDIIYASPNIFSHYGFIIGTALFFTVFYGRNYFRT